MAKTDKMDIFAICSAWIFRNFQNFGSKKNNYKAPRPWNSASFHLGRFWEVRICHFCSLGFVLSTIYISDLPSLNEAYVAVIQRRLPKWWSKNIYSVTSIDPSITTISSRDEYDTDVQSFILNQQIIKFIAVPISLLEWCWDWVQGGEPLYAAAFSLSSCHSHIWPIFVNFFLQKAHATYIDEAEKDQKINPSNQVVFKDNFTFQGTFSKIEGQRLCLWLADSYI